jgi:hypothetical protein
MVIVFASVFWTIIVLAFSFSGISSGLQVVIKKVSVELLISRQARLGRVVIGVVIAR